MDDDLPSIDKVGGGRLRKTDDKLRLAGRPTSACTSLDGRTESVRLQVHDQVAMDQEVAHGRSHLSSEPLEEHPWVLVVGALRPPR